MHPYFAMLVPVLYTLIQSNRPQTKSKFQIVSKILRNPGKLTLCWLKKKFDDAKYRIRSRAGQHRKKEKAIAFPIFARGNRWAYQLRISNCFKNIQKSRKYDIVLVEKKSTTRIASVGLQQDNIEKEKAIAFPVFARENRLALYTSIQSNRLSQNFKSFQKYLEIQEN